MENGKCKKEFPKAFQEETNANVNGYPKYQRRRKLPVDDDADDDADIDADVDADLQSKGINNSWVVPYNPYLSQKYNCHINVEICASVMSVKYLYKYVHKGYDCMNVEITHDEVKNFLDSRYISPPEAMWRTNGYLMHWQSHSVIRLAVHLPREQSVVFLEGKEKQAAETVKDTTLLAWFKLNQEQSSHEAMVESLDNDDQDIAIGDAFDDIENIEVSEEVRENEEENKNMEIPKQVRENEEKNDMEIDTADDIHCSIKVQDLLYTEIPKHFVFKKGVWIPRKQRGDKVISRMYTVGMNDPERFYLRILLLHVRGAKSFEYLRTVDGVLYDTFQDACRARKLLADDTEWDNALTEAAELDSASKIRLTFALICAYGNPGDILSLWNKHKAAMTEDFENLRKYDPENRALLDIESIVRQNSVDYNKLGLPQTTPINDILSEYDLDKERKDGEDGLLKLNSEQKYIYDMVMKAIDDPTEPNRFFFIDGPGGSGKTFLYNTLLSVLRGRGDSVLPVAPTGIAGTLLAGGTTYYTQLKLPVPLTATSSSKMRLKSPEADKIRAAKLIVWDEAGMTSGIALEVVNRLLKEVLRNEKPFGNMVTLFGGDFRQILPVVPHGHRVIIIEETIKMCSLWPHITPLKLTTNMRAADDKDFASWLIELGDGKLTNSYDLGEDIFEIPQEFICKGSLIDEVFAKKFTAIEAEDFENRAILCSLNEDTLKMNDEVLSRLEGVEKVYYSVDSVVTDDEEERTNFPTEFLNSITPSGMPVHGLKLKVGAIVILLRNICKNRALCNGTRLIVTGMKENVIFAKVLTGKSTGDIIAIPRIDLAPSDISFPFILRRRQFPIRVAFVMTINKSQGQTLDKVGLYLSQPVFSHGQLYVAFSRVICKSNIKVQVLNTKGQGNLLVESDKVFTSNVVYKEIL